MNSKTFNMESYIKKSDVAAEIERRIKEISKECEESKTIQFTLIGKINALENLLPFLNTIKVKGVDLDGEINLWVRNLHRVPNFEELKKFARHFFELGLKAQKGENAKEERYVVGVTGKYTATTK